MALKNIPYKKLEYLIKENISLEEHKGTAKLINELNHIKDKKYLTKKELIKICKWKSSRVIHHIKSNSEKKIKEITKKVFSTNYEKNKLTFLLELKGVSIPMASAILMLTNPKQYGVIDIRVWQLLHKMGTVNSNPDGMGFTFKEWYRYLKIIQYFAKKFKVNARDIERTLFQVHKKYQKGNLY